MIKGKTISETERSAVFREISCALYFFLYNNNFILIDNSYYHAKMLWYHNNHNEWQVRVLVSLFPPLLLDLFKMLIAPINGGKVASMMLGKSMLIVLILV